MTTHWQVRYHGFTVFRSHFFFCLVCFWLTFVSLLTFFFCLHIIPYLKPILLWMYYNILWISHYRLAYFFCRGHGCISHSTDFFRDGCVCSGSGYRIRSGCRDGFGRVAALAKRRKELYNLGFVWLCLYSIYLLLYPTLYVENSNKCN